MAIFRCNVKKRFLFPSTHPLFHTCKRQGKTIMAVITTVLPLNGMMKHTGNPRVKKEGRGE